MSKHIHVYGANHEAINACIFLASLDNQVTLFSKKEQGKQGEIEQTLVQYKFDNQMSALWKMFVNEQKIMHQVIDKSHNFEFNDNAITWLFADDLSDDELQNFIRSQNSPHSQIIVSGTKAIGDIDAFAKHLKSAWVYYLPFIFMKDGANFSSFFQADLVMIGEKTADSVGACELLLFLQKQAKTCEISDIKTIEFARSSIMAMLATRLSFMNEMARLADNQKININKIKDIMGKDSRIGSAYLSAGWGFGGKSLPTEIELLSQIFNKNQVHTKLLSAVEDINNDQKELIFRKFWRYFDGFIENKTVLIWGAGYRIGTSRITNSAIHELLKLLWSYQIRTIVYAKNTAFELAEQYGDEPLLTLTDKPYDSLPEVASLFIINWSDLLPPDVNELNRAGVPIFDAKNILTDSQVADLTGFYTGIGR